MKSTTKAAIKKYTEEVCIECYDVYAKNSMGAKSIGEQFNLTTRQADAAINAGRELSTNKGIQLVPDFFIKAAQEIDKKYFPELKYYRDDDNCAAVHYALECFSNGVYGYHVLIYKLSKACNDTPENIHSIISTHIQDYGGYIFDPSLSGGDAFEKPRWPASMYNKSKR